MGDPGAVFSQPNLIQMQSAEHRILATSKIPHCRRPLGCCACGAILPRRHSASVGVGRHHPEALGFKHRYAGSHVFRAQHLGARCQLEPRRGVAGYWGYGREAADVGPGCWEAAGKVQRAHQVDYCLGRAGYWGGGWVPGGSRADREGMFGRRGAGGGTGGGVVRTGRGVGYTVWYERKGRKKGTGAVGCGWS